MDVKTIAVIGAGTMGRGIAYAAALGGYNTVLEDVSRPVLDEGLAWIRRSFEEGVTRGKVDASVRDQALSLISAASNEIRDSAWSRTLASTLPRVTPSSNDRRIQARPSSSTGRETSSRTVL